MPSKNAMQRSKSDRPKPRETVEKELLDHNYAPANRAVREWMETGGEAISKLLFRRAEWATAHAAADLRAYSVWSSQNVRHSFSRLLAAKHGSTSSLWLIWKIFAARKATSRRQEQPHLLTSSTAQPNCSIRTPDIGSRIAEREAIRRWDGGHYYVALPVTNLAFKLLLQSVGKVSVKTLRMQQLQAGILDQLGRSHEALPIAQSVTADQAAHPTLGPTRQTLASRHLVAQILDNLGHDKERFPSHRVSLRRNRYIEPGANSP